MPRRKVMIPTMKVRVICLLTILLMSGLFQSASAAEKLAFELRFDHSVRSKPFDGRVYVLLSRGALKQPPGGVNWFNPEPLFALDVKGWKPGEAVTLADNAIGFPTPLRDLKKGKYGLMAVLDLNQGYSSFANAPGNLYSEGVMHDLDPVAGGTIKLLLNKVVPPRAYEDTERVKFVEIESKLLTAFHGRPTKLRAGVVLPKSYSTNKSQRYPIIYEIPGFGGTHTGALGAVGRNVTEVAGTSMLHVTLDPACTWGHHVFADSANNGPCGKALIEELIPAIESRFRAKATSGTRFVTGHSSGGWSSLWLQVTYPDTFGGVWSTAPDPVDFRDFQRIDIYEKDANTFFDSRGELRPIARMGGKPRLFYKPFSQMEDVMGHGGQLNSFEAVFGPRGDDGRPRRLWDRLSGKVDPVTAKAWEEYDIRLVLERNWAKLSQKLAGKIHVYMGSEDTFYLDGAAVLLKESLAKLGSDAIVELFPGKDHGTLMDSAMRKRIAQEMANQARRAEDKAP